MSIGQEIPWFADDFLALTQASSSTKSGTGQILLGIAVVSSTSGTVTIGTVNRGAIVTNYPLVAGWNPFPFACKGGDQFEFTGGGTYSGTALLQNP